MISIEVIYRQLLSNIMFMTIIGLNISGWLFILSATFMSHID